MFRHRRTADKPKPWFERDGGAALRKEQALVEHNYPCLIFAADPVMAGMQLMGTITLLSDCGVKTPLSVRIEFPADYPLSEPDAYDEGKHFPEDVDRHIVQGGRFCLWLPPCSPWNPEDPNRLLRFLDEVAVFLERQLVYDATGQREWPGPQQKHGRAGYENFMVELLGGNEADLKALLPLILGRSPTGRNDLCPCRSERKYKHCHERLVSDIVRRIGRSQLSHLYPSRPALAT